MALVGYPIAYEREQSINREKITVDQRGRAFDPVGCEDKFSGTESQYPAFAGKSGQRHRSTD
jgi:hypothetical protein